MELRAGRSGTDRMLLGRAGPVCTSRQSPRIAADVTFMPAMRIYVIDSHVLAVVFKDD